MPFKKNNPGCPCCTCSVTFRLIGCNSCRIAGADVDWVFGGSTVYSGTTDANGNMVNPAAVPGDYTFNWSISGTALSGTATGTVTMPCSNQIIPHTISTPAGYTCYTNCAIPYPSSLFITDDAGTRALGACVLWTNPSSGLIYSISTYLASTGTCDTPDAPQWRVQSWTEFPGFPTCPQTSPAVVNTFINQACARPFSLSANYGANPSNILASRPFLIHE